VHFSSLRGAMRRHRPRAAAPRNLCVGLLLLAAFVASSCGGGEDEPTPTVTAPVAVTATQSPTPTSGTPATPPHMGARAPGQVRTLPEGMLDQHACYALGEADVAQDRSAGATLERTERQASWRFTGGSGFIFSLDRDPTGDGLRITVLWTEPEAVVKAEVFVAEAGGPDQVPCAQAYIDGYRGVPFELHAPP
jgi:hypothetical protein